MMYYSPMERISHIGEALVRERRARGISQRVLGDVLGVSQQQVARWERSGYRRATLERVGAVAEVLGVTVRVDVRPAPRVVEPGASAEGTSNARSEVTAGESGSGRANDLADVLSRLREHGPALSERFGVTLIDVFGSFARGEQTDTSFVALVVELEQATISSVIGSDLYLQEILGRSVQAGPLSSIPAEEQRLIAAERVRAWPVA